MGTPQKLADMVALSQAFQDECALYKVEKAAERIHRWIVQEPDSLPRPFAVIEVDGADTEMTSGGARNEFRLSETLLLFLATELPNPESSEDSLEAFWEWGKNVQLDVLSLAGVDDYLNITAMPCEQKPLMSAPEDGAERPYLWMVWRIEIGGHT